MDISGDAIFEGGEGLVVACGAKAVHVGLGEVLILVADVLRRIDEVNIGLAIESREERVDEIQECPCLAGADIEKSADFW